MHNSRYDFIKVMSGGICEVANSSFSEVKSVLLNQVLFSRLPEEEKATFEKYKDVYKKGYLGFDKEDGKYFEYLEEDLD